MRFLPAENNEVRLRLAVNIYLEDLGTINSRLPAVKFFNEVQHKVQKGIAPAIGINTLFIGNQFFRFQDYFRKQPPEVVRSIPVNRTNLIIQQTCRGQ